MLLEYPKLYTSEELDKLPDEFVGEPDVDTLFCSSCKCEFDD